MFEVLDVEKLVELLMKILHTQKHQGEKGKKQDRAKKMKTLLNYIRQIFNHRSGIHGRELLNGLKYMGLIELSEVNST